ncbi:MAG: UDP-N-acetylmuramoyl-L-alanyl-D-glutamate--2,6-diaminopimelate ligase, partial [Clostridia bacterium]|nr:UDP-N-acetylmuramoyl-L-alanyl-D-glutamate--2,6-diaminopimelate ligase [Clostridia bacterium]
MKLSDLLSNVGILSSQISLEEEVTGITLDTRRGCEGALYAALPSLSDPNRHGLDYVEAAKKGGAKAVLLDRDAD